MKYIVIENRDNITIRLCEQSAKKLNLDFDVVKNTNAGKHYDEFSEKYIHLSTNSKEFELICFRRYFLLLDFIEANQLDEVVLLDSDVLLFHGINKYVEHIRKQGDFVGSYIVDQSSLYMRISPHISYWTKHALKEFIGYLSKAYDDDAIRHELIDIKNTYSNNGWLGGVSDMTLLYLWAKSNDYLGSSTKVINGMTADHNLTSRDNYYEREFQSTFGVKQLNFRNGLPYGINSNGEIVQFVLLHFQGRSKYLMQECFEGNYFSFGVKLKLIGLIKTIRKYFYKAKPKSWQ